MLPLRQTKRTIFFTWMRFGHVLKKKMLPLEKMSLCISNCRNDLSEPTRTRRSRCRSFGFQELSSELTFRIEQSMSMT